ncbi:MAG: asparagine synthase (glutamine-hydrolyzing) [Clostridia bacterium]|nr:asparagine synthase (glutamine-hydrolyzing) [Clostridia bacterium]
MCGIAGQIAAEAEIAERGRTDVYRNMLSSMRHRGPDQDGTFIDGCAALLHARLAIVDLENGRQPMTLIRGGQEYTLVYNGELYNTDELREQLLKKGHKFKGYSDTEVLLHSYVEWRDGCVERLNGIFAFAVWESHTRQLFLARDRIGVKPLFYANRGGSLLFASEIKTLLCHPLVQPVIDRQGLTELIAVGPGRTPGCGVFRDVREVMPGCCGYYDQQADKLTLRTYWTLADRVCSDSFETAVEKVRWLVTDAIKRQLVSDVPVCTFLSGGLDSSIISAVARRHLAEQGKVLDTMTIDYRGNDVHFHSTKFQPTSDSAYVPIMSGFLGSRQHTVVIETEQLVPALYEAVRARDLPGMADVDASLLLFCKEIRKTATVALSGECADEIFGGYPWFRDKTIRDRYGFPWAQSTDYRASFLREDLAAKIDCAGYVNERYQQTLSETPVLPLRDADETRMRQMVMLNFRWFMQTLLDRKDRMSMYSSLEVRVPFCDYRIAEYLYTLPWEYKDYKSVEKGLLRKAMRGLLPDEILWRKKSPYPKTHNPAYLTAVSDELRQVLADHDSPIFELVSRDALEGLLSADLSTPWYGQLMTTPQTIAYMLQLNYWMKQYGVKIVD